MLKKSAFGCACAAAILSVIPATAAPLGNGVRLPAITQPLLGIANNGGLVLPVLGADLPLLSTSLASPLLAGPLGSSPSLPNQLLVPGLAVASPVIFAALPGLDGAAGQGLAPVLNVASPIVDDAVSSLVSGVREVNGPGPGAPPGSAAGR
jgi:hypothetical protein